MSAWVRFIAGPLVDSMIVRPSMPTGTSMIVLTPLWTQLSYSLFLISREASSTSGCWLPTPAQNSFIPAPVPVDSTVTLMPGLARMKSSATALVNG
jgi:hypothetical protein